MTPVIFIGRFVKQQQLASSVNRKVLLKTTWVKKRKKSQFFADWVMSLAQVCRACHVSATVGVVCWKRHVVEQLLACWYFYWLALAASIRERKRYILALKSLHLHNFHHHQHHYRHHGCWVFSAARGFDFKFWSNSCLTNLVTELSCV